MNGKKILEALMESASSPCPYSWTYYQKLKYRDKVVYKSTLLQEGYDKLWMTIQKAKYYLLENKGDYSLLNDEEKEQVMQYFNEEEKTLLNAIGDPRTYNVFVTMKVSNYKRARRVLDHITPMVQKPCLFLTLTFTDKVLSRTSLETRRRYVARTLKKLGCKYVANVDFGKQNGREHYHALVQVERIDHSIWRYGAINFQRVRNGNTKALAKYISKLKNHALKETAQNKRIIYSKEC